MVRHYTGLERRFVRVNYKLFRDSGRVLPLTGNEKKNPTSQAAVLSKEQVPP